MIVTVKSMKEKEDILRESEYLHYNRDIDTDKCNSISHLWMKPELIRVEPEELIYDNDKATNGPSIEDESYRKLKKRELKDKSKVDPTTGCWIMQKGKNDGKYAHIKCRRTKDSKEGNIKAHIVSYLIHHGETGGQQVQHKCHRPLCVNPDHLKLGTQRINEQDKVLAGNCHLAKLNENKVIDIKISLLMDSGKENIQRLADRYGVQSGTIKNIDKGKSWSYVKIPQDRYPQLETGVLAV